MSSRIGKEIQYILLRNYYSWKIFFVYRTQAFLWILESAFSTLVSYISISVIYSVSSGIAGWSYYQILFLAATSNMMFGLIYYFVNPNSLMNIMTYGNLDQKLTKPYTKFSIMITESGFVGSVGTFISGLVLLAYSLGHLQLGLLHTLGYGVLFITGTLVFAVFITMFTILSYKLVKGAGVVYRGLNLSSTISNYPLSVYGVVGALIFSLLFPIGLAYYYPAAAFFGKISLQSYLLALLASVLIGVLSYELFNFLMRSYTSGGG